MSGSPPVFTGVSAPGSPPGSPRALRELSAVSKNTTWFAASSAELGEDLAESSRRAPPGCRALHLLFPVFYGVPALRQALRELRALRCGRKYNPFCRVFGGEGARSRGELVESHAGMSGSPLCFYVFLGSGSSLGPLRAPRELSAVGPRDARSVNCH